ncbi:hypothetical protein [Accumulibacter sp.]|uniref:hypothetical protein n=1 Tax=Accumulibacter sp. TaxID=2053492 RepID=UPI00262D4BD7|nr:hypothetical protein [Accumulibacter sp.]
MANLDAPEGQHDPASSSVLFDRLLGYRERHGILGPASALSTTERRRLDEARQAVRCLGLPAYLVPARIIEQSSLEALLSNTLKNPFGTSLDAAGYLDRYAFYFFFAPLRVASLDFKEAEINLRSDWVADSETGEHPRFFALFPRTETRDAAKWEESLEIGLNGQVQLSAATPEALSLGKDTKAAAAAAAGATLKAKFTQAVTRVWRDVLIRTSVPPDVVATWRFRCLEQFSQGQPAIAFILQVPRGLKWARISYEIRLRFNAAPWERVIAQWVGSLRSLWTDLSPEEQRDVCLLEGYVRDGLWSAHYSEQPMAWEFDERDFSH